MSAVVRWLLAVAVAAGAALRFANLSRWSIDGDELYSWYDVTALLAGESWPEGVRSHPLGYLGMALAVALGGLDELTLRLFPALCGTAAVAALAWMRSDAVPRGAALLAASLAALSPWLVYHAQEARFYAPLLLCAALATLWALPGRGSRPAASGVAFAAAALCHPSAVLLGPCLALPWVRSTSRRHRVGLVAVLVAAGAAGLWMAVGSDVVRRALTRETLADYDAAHFVLGLGYNVGPGTWLVFLVGLAAWCRRRAAPWGTVTAAACGPPALLLLLSLAGVSIHQRYAMAAVPAILLLAGHGGAAAVRGSQLLGGALVALALLAPLPALLGHHADGNRHDMRGAAAWLTSHADPEDIVVADEHATLGLYLRRDPRFADTPLFEAPLDPVQDAKKLEEFPRNRRQVWIVLKVSRRASGYGEEFMDWVTRYFTELDVLGVRPSPLVRHDNRLVVYRRTERERPAGTGRDGAGPSGGEPPSDSQRTGSPGAEQPGPRGGRMR